MKKEKRNYYKEIDEALKSYEEFKPYHTKRIEWVTNRINWCWKFRHISKKQMEELTNRVCKTFEVYYNIGKII